MQKTMKTFFHCASLALASTLLFSSCEKDKTEMLVCDDIESTKTLSNHNEKGDGIDYTIGCNLYVRSKLIIEAGTTIEFSQGGAIIIEENGSLEIRGTASNKVVLRAEDNSSTRGVWAGIIIYSNDVSNLIEHAVISGGGGEEFNSNGDLGNVVVYHGARLTARNTTFSNSEAFGLNVLTATNVTLSNLNFTGCAKPLALPASQAHKIDAASTYTDNDNQFVEVSVGGITEIVTWQSLPIPYRIVPTSGGLFTVIGPEDNGGLTVAAGADIEFSANCGIGAYGTSYLRFEGNSSQNVSLRGLTNTAGAWKGVYFETNNTQNSLDYVNITGAGSEAFNSNNNIASVVAFAGSALNVSNCNISNGLVCGIYIGDQVNITQNNNTFSNLPSNTCTD
jgi:hypothetical protein